MAYILTQDVIDRVGAAVAAQLSAESGSVVDAGVMTQVVEDAEGEVNGYLAKRFQTPIDVSVDEDLATALEGVTLKVAVFHLFSRRPPVDKVYVTEHDAAIAWLQGVVDGSIALPGATAPPPAATGGPAKWGSSKVTASRQNMI